MIHLTVVSSVRKRGFCSTTSPRAVLPCNFKVNVSQSFAPSSLSVRRRRSFPRRVSVCLSTESTCPLFLTHLRAPSACLYEGKSYSFGESVPHRDPCQHCVCINSTSGPMMSCAISECFNSWTALQPNCYRKYTEGKCCPEIVCVPENQSLSTCEHEGNIYNFGDYFSPEGDPCHNCLCDERWNSSSNNNSSKQLLDTVCTRLECHFDFDRPENRGCVPVYSEKACCPMYFHCRKLGMTKCVCV